MDEDYEALIRLVEAHLHAVGLSGLADENRYGFTDREEGQFRLYPPDKRLDLMLAAFERHLTVRDSESVSRSLAAVNAELEFGRVADAEIVPAQDGTGRAPARLSGGPNLHEPIEMLRKLRISLHDQRLGESDPSQ